MNVQWIGIVFQLHFVCNHLTTRFHGMKCLVTFICIFMYWWILIIDSGDVQLQLKKYSSQTTYKNTSVYRHRTSFLRDGMHKLGWYVKLGASHLKNVRLLDCKRQLVIDPNEHVFWEWFFLIDSQYSHKGFWISYVNLYYLCRAI